MIHNLSNKKKLLILVWIVYVLFLISKRNGIVYPTLIQNYFSDLLALPLTLGTALWVLRIYTRDSTYKLNWSKILVAVIYFSIVFEWYLPQKNSVYISDIWDIVAYFTGGFVFYFFQKY